MEVEAMVISFATDVATGAPPLPNNPHFFLHLDRLIRYMRKLLLDFNYPVVVQPYFPPITFIDIKLFRLNI